jgi:hypothetical protein
MSNPGEINQIIGQSYVKVLTGCLEYTVKPFQKQFDVYTSPEKLMFNKGGGKGTFSFDAMGIYKHPLKPCEMFIESKGYSVGSSLLKEYREFVAKSYITTVLNSRHSKDYFCFVTNVPFGSSEGKKLTSVDFLTNKALNPRDDAELHSILGDIPIDRDYVESLSKRLSVCFFTDSFIRISGISYKVQDGESIWTILEDLHAKQVPDIFIRKINSTVQSWNPQVKDIDLIVTGEVLHSPWYGINEIDITY